MKAVTVVFLAGSVSFAFAGPGVENFRAGVNWSQRTTASTFQITGTVSQTITSPPTGYGTINKPAGSLSGSVNLQALDPTFPINATAFFTGTELSNERVRWAITCPDAIGQDITVEGTTIRITSVSGTYTAVFSPISPVLDPVSGLPRNASHTKSAADTNQLVIRGNVNGLFFLPITATQTVVEYDGFSGGAGLGVVRGVATLQGAASAEGLNIAVSVNGNNYNSAVAAGGAWAVITNFQGTHEVVTKLPTGLSRRTAGVNLATGSPSLALTYLNGDCNGDNIVDIADYAILAGAFDATPTSSNWAVSADLNRDEIIDIADYALLAGTFDGVGE